MPRHNENGLWNGGTMARRDMNAGIQHHSDGHTTAIVRGSDGVARTVDLGKTRANTVVATNGELTIQHVGEHTTATIPVVPGTTGQLATVEDEK